MPTHNIHVAAAIICKSGKVLACRRETGPYAQMWEFPGGKLEEGEDSVAACKREILEELGCRLSTTWLLHTAEYDYPDFHLTMDCFVCVPIPNSEPKATEHDQIRWLGPHELLDVEWLPADVEVAKLVGTHWDMLFAAEHL